MSINCADDVAIRAFVFMIPCRTFNYKRNPTILPCRDIPIISARDIRVASRSKDAYRWLPLVDKRFGESLIFNYSA